MILVIDTDENGRTQFAPTVSRIIKQFKGSITKQVGKPIWQKSFYDHRIRNQQDYDEIWQYIENNPLKYTLKKAPFSRCLFAGERSSPLQSCATKFVGATCGRPLEQGSYPINNPINDTRNRSVDNHRACNFKHISADAEDEALCCCQYRTLSF